MANNGLPLGLPERICVEGSAERYLEQLKPSSDLKARAIRGGTVTVLSNGLALAIQMGGSIILARLLTPRDYGLVAMVTTFSLLLQNFGYNGFIEAIIQCGTITREQLSTLFWINVGLNSLLTLLFVVASPLLAWFYHEPELRAVSAAVAFSILFGSLGTQHLGLLQRNMQFGIVSLNFVGATLISLFAAITMAWFGWGYWALVANTLLLPLSTAVGAWLWCGWRPGRPSRKSGVYPMVKFAMHTYGNFCANYVGRNLDKFLVGWRFGSAPLGNYKRAYDLFALPVSQLTSPLTGVALAGLSRLREEPDKYQRNYLKVFSFVAFVGFGLSALLTVTGKDLVRLLLGPKWDEAGRLLVYFGPGTGIMLIYSTNSWLHLSLGRADRWFRWGVFEMVATSSLVIVGLLLGPHGVALAWSCSFFLLFWPALAYAGQPIGLRFSSILAAAWKYAVAASVAGVLCWFLPVWIKPLGNWLASAGTLVRVVTLTCSLGVLYLMLLLQFAFSTTLGPILDFLKALKRK